MIGIICRNFRTELFHWSSKRNLYVLGIESSCDETSAAVMNDSKEILGEGHYSQARLHLEAGGIVPLTAYYLHSNFIKSMVEDSMKKSSLSFSDLDAIAVTVKPGLLLSLRAGLNHAKDLCTTYSKPLIPIHHMQAHALTARLTNDVKFPFMTVLISGAHSTIAVVESVDKFKTLGSSSQKAPGTVLDLIARRAKLNNSKKFKGLVGGAAIEAAAEGGDSSKFVFPERIYFHQSKHCDFSFSPILSVAEKYLTIEEKNHNLEPDEIIPNINDFCAAALLAVARHLCQRLEIAIHYVNFKELLKEHEKCLVMSGGVACNTFLRKAVKKICNKYGYKLVVPPAKFCSDNGVMIAWNGIERLKENLPVVQPHNLSSVVETHRCPLGEDLSENVKEIGKILKFNYTTLDSYSEIAMSEEI